MSCLKNPYVILLWIFKFFLKIILHVFIVYYKWYHACFEWLVTLLPIFILKHEKLSINFTWFWLQFYMFIIVHCKIFNHRGQIYLLINEYKAHHMVLYDLNTKYVIEITFVHNFKCLFQNSFKLTHVNFILLLTIMALSTL